MRFQIAGCAVAGFLAASTPPAVADATCSLLQGQVLTVVAEDLKGTTSESRGLWFDRLRKGEAAAFQTAGIFNDTVAAVEGTCADGRFDLTVTLPTNGGSFELTGALGELAGRISGAKGKLVAIVDGKRTTQTWTGSIMPPRGVTSAELLGWQTFEGNGLRFRYPPGWAVEGPRSAGSGLALPAVSIGGVVGAALGELPAEADSARTIDLISNPGRPNPNRPIIVGAREQCIRCICVAVDGERIGLCEPTRQAYEIFGKVIATFQSRPGV